MCNVTCEQLNSLHHLVREIVVDEAMKYKMEGQ